MMHKNVQYLINRGWKFQQSGVQAVGRCPSYNHTDNSPSFSVNIETGEFNCFSCDCKGKSLVTLMMCVENITKEEAVAKLNPEKKHEAPEIYRTLQKYFYNYGQKVMSSKVSEIIKERGFSTDIVKKYGIGYSDSSCIKTLINYGVDPEAFVNEKFLNNNSYIGNDRLTIPILKTGKVIGFSMRATRDHQDRKYINIIKNYNRDWLYGLNTKADYVIVTEGVFDVIRLKEYGYEACCSFGTSMTEAQANNLKQFKTVYLMYDGDTAGQIATSHFFEKYSHKMNRVMICELPKGKDPDKCTKNEIEASFDNAMHIFEFLLKESKACGISAAIDNLRKLRHKLPKEPEAELFSMIIENEILKQLRPLLKNLCFANHLYWEVYNRQTDQIEFKGDHSQCSNYADRYGYRPNRPKHIEVRERKPDDADKIIADVLETFVLENNKIRLSKYNNKVLSVWRKD